MKTFISLLRGINVSGQNKLGMSELKASYESLGMANVVTYIQSGNVIFDCAKHDPVLLARLIETKKARSFGTSIRIFLRDRNRFKQIIESNPFLNQRNEDPEKLHVTFLSGSPPESVLNNLLLPAGIPDEFLVYDKEIYLFCPNGYGRTKISNSFFERKLGFNAMTRNWKTVMALYKIAIQRHE
jgi:uncharacterized protein (DUF1697 family)